VEDRVKTAFELSNFAVMPFWALMILAPRARFTARALSSPWIVLPPLLAYAWAVLPVVPQLLPELAQPELESVQSLLGAPLGAFAGWAHFLAFDLFVGRFIVLDARERTLPWFVLSPLLALTLLFGPLGLLGYLILRAAVSDYAKRAYQRAWQSSPQLSVLGLLSLLTAAVCGVLQLFDARLLAGAPIWLKPIKFGVSIAIFSFTLAWLLRVIDVPTKARSRLLTVITWCTGLELVVITGQAARGVASHFNNGSGLDRSLFFVMGVAITMVTVAVARLGVYAYRTKFADAALGSAVRIGIALMVFGSCIAFIMPRPTSSQLQSMQAGEPTPQLGAHTVGAPDDSTNGLAFTRWSTEGGDLRVPHFIGLHALQLLPMLALALGRRFRDQPLLARSLTRSAGTAYFGVTFTALVQALCGQPVLSPDALTLAMLAGFLALSAAMAIAAALHKPAATPVLA
jgi:hypothetical protein